MDIGFEVADHVATITLDRPDAMNAFTPRMARELIDALDWCDGDDAVRCVILTGAGDRAFCAGADLSAGGSTFDYAAYEEARDLPMIDEETFSDLGGLVTMRLFAMHKPLIAAVNGAAAGVGASMAIACDIRIASDTARFGFVFTRRGIAPDAASSWFLPRIVGISTALRWMYSGRLIDAEEAARRGLVETLHSRDALLAEARAIARDVAENCAPVSVAVTRRLLWDMLGAANPIDAHRADSRAIQSRGVSDDVREGVTAFLEKRQPRFVDRVSRDMPELYPGRMLFAEAPTPPLD